MKTKHFQRGSSLPETVIVMSVLLALMFGIIDFGRALYTYGFVTTIAREGARWASVRGSSCALLDHCPANSGTTDIETYVQGLSEGATTASSLTATLSFPSCPAGVSSTPTNKPGCNAMVTVSYPFTFIAPFVSNAKITMTSTSQMVISQ
jgi:Flp pilus assembly protein TadG